MPHYLREVGYVFDVCGHGLPLWRHGLPALAPRALLVLVAHLVRVGVQTDAVGHRASILVAEASGPLVLGALGRHPFTTSALRGGGGIRKCS